MDKQCNTCFEAKPEIDFKMYQNKSGTSHGPKCKKCVSKTNAERLKWRYHNEDGFKESRVEYRKENPEIFRRKRKRDYEKNRQRYITQAVEWNRKNKVLRRQISRKYKIRRSGWEFSGSYSKAEWDALVKACGGKCLSCLRTDRKLTADHVIPLSRGGSNTIDNIQPLCGPCNSSKGTKITDHRRR